jgi:deazaflavin-dependent oxidoreductase (nitroreductase family)
VPIWSIVEHVGRRSGKTYRTPVSVFRTRDGVAILLPYGTDRDWVRNVQARRRRPSEGVPLDDDRARRHTNRRSRRLFATTNTDDAAIAAPAIIGLSMPNAASGMAATL